MSQIRTGLDQLIADPAPLAGRRYGLLCHPASVAADLTHATDALRGCGAGQLRAIFGPQHGVTAHTQDNMIEWAGYDDPRLGLPVYSLYGAVRQPTPAMLEGLDLLVIDLQDVGCRVYTYVWTMALAMEACARAGLEVLVLDRPNPLGRLAACDGPFLQPGFESFVGLHPLTLRHDLTSGELARLVQRTTLPELALTVLPLAGWRREPFDQTGLPWVLPSPNMPTLDTAIVYPGQVLFEGTTLSEGRGTTRPFEIVGAPGIDPYVWAAELEALALPGVRFRPLFFEPTFQKHAGAVCGGVQLHVLDRTRYDPCLTAALLLTKAQALFPTAWTWLDPPYEYVHDRWPIDILSGGPQLRTGVAAGWTAEQWHSAWAAEAATCTAQAADARLYAAG